MRTSAGGKETRLGSNSVRTGGGALENLGNKGGNAKSPNDRPPNKKKINKQQKGKEHIYPRGKRMEVQEGKWRGKEKSKISTTNARTKTHLLNDEKTYCPEPGGEDKEKKSRDRPRGVPKGRERDGARNRSKKDRRRKIGKGGAT